MIEAVEEETRDFAPEQFVVIDPDSRLLQLGLLPAVRDERRYFFLESRRYGEPGQGSVSRITLGWLNGVFGGSDEIFPAVNLREEDRDLGQELCRQLRQSGAGFLVAASFGVGGNQRKRLPDPFEEQLLSRLLDDGCTVLLDKGVGEEERNRANRLVERVRAGGRAVFEMNQRSARAELAARELRCRMLTRSPAPTSARLISPEKLPDFSVFLGHHSRTSPVSICTRSKPRECARLRRPWRTRFRWRSS